MSPTLVAAGCFRQSECRRPRKQPSPAQQPPRSACVGDNGGITLSAGFCATVFADKLGHAWAHGGRSEPGRLRQYLERPLLP